MPIVTFLHQNHGLNAAWDAKSQTPGLPACHAGDENRQRVWRSTGAGTCDWLRASLCSTAKTVDRVAFVSYNFTTCAALTIEAHCTSAFDTCGPGFTTCFAPWAAARTKVCFADLSAAQTYKWWRVLACDTGNDDGYYEVGVLALGLVTCMDVGLESLTYSIADPSRVEYAPAGTPKTWKLNPFAEVELPHRFIAESLVFGELQDVLRNLGLKNDGVLSVFSTAPSCSTIALATNLYGRLTWDPSFRYVIPGKYHGSLRFRESL